MKKKLWKNHSVENLFVTTVGGISEYTANPNLFVFHIEIVRKGPM